MLDSLTDGVAWLLPQSIKVTLVRVESKVFLWQPLEDQPEQL